MRGVGALGADVGDLGERVEIFAIRFAAVDCIELGKQLGFVAELLLKVIPAEKLQRPLGRLGALLGDEPERFGEGVARRRTERDPLGAGRGAAGSRKEQRREDADGERGRRA